MATTGEGNASLGRTCGFRLGSTAGATMMIIVMLMMIIAMMITTLLYKRFLFQSPHLFCSSDDGGAI